MNFIVLLFAFSLLSFGAENQVAVNGLLDAEISATEKRLKVKPLPVYYVRLLSLYSEKCKITKDIENEEYLKNISNNSNKPKDSFFIKSLDLAKEADDLGNKIVKLYPDYARMGEIYFLMGTNDRDFGKGLKTENYFLNALSKFSKITPNSPMVFDVKSALADFYYNEKKYQKAIAFYEEILKDKNNVWWTKYAYHYSWCLLKIEQNSKALSSLLNVYEISKNSKAINMTQDILVNIGLFFYYAKELPASLDFYKKETSEPLTYGLKMANLLLKKGHLKEAKDYFLSISGLATNDHEKFGVLLGLLSLHHEKREFSEFNSVVLQMENLKPKTELHEDFIHQLKLAIKDGQEILTRKKENVDLAANLVHFYEVISKFDQKELIPSLFYSGEIFYQVNSLLLAKDKYKACVLSSSEQSIKYVELCFDALEAVIAENEKTNPSVESQHLYAHYLKLLPQGKLASILWRRLFIVYLTEKNLNKLNDLISTYHQNFKEDISYQKDMMTKLLSLAIDLKATKILEDLNTKLSKGFLGFDPEFRQKSWDVLGNLKLAEIHGKTPSQLTLSMAQSIYDTKEFNQSIRIKASYNMAVALFHLEKTKEANLWLLKTLKIMTLNDLNKSYPEYAGFLIGYFNHHDKDSLLTLTQFLKESYCEHDEKKTYEVIRTSIHYLLIDNYLDEALNLYQGSKDCFKSITHTETIQTDFFNFLLETNNVQKFIELATQFNQLNHSQYFDFLIKFSVAGDEFAYNKIQSFRNDSTYLEHPYFKNQVITSEYQQIGTSLELMASTNLSDLEKKFDENELMARLQNILKKLADDKNQVNKFYNYKNAEYSMKLTQKLSQNYQLVIEKLSNFKPVIDDKEYKATLMWSIRSMRKNLEKEEKNITKNLRAVAGKVSKSSDMHETWDVPMVIGLKIPRSIH